MLQVSADENDILCRSLLASLRQSDDMEDVVVDIMMSDLSIFYESPNVKKQ